MPAAAAKSPSSTGGRLGKSQTEPGGLGRSASANSTAGKSGALGKTAPGGLGRVASPSGRSRASGDSDAESGGEDNVTFAASEPPYAAMPDMSGRFEQLTQGTYQSVGHKARGTKLHEGPLKLRPALPVPRRLQWQEQNPLYHPYSYFENANNKPSPLPKRAKAPPALWLPVRSKQSGDDRRRRAETEPEEKPPTPKRKLSLGSQLLQKAGELPQEKPKAEKKINPRDPKIPPMLQKPWDTEHHIMESKKNAEVQVGYREYFDKPVRKECEGVPKVREVYSMNDRQCGWCDEPAPVGELGYRRTFFDWVAPFNVGGVKAHQQPSYWRNAVTWSASAPTLVEPAPSTRYKEPAADTSKERTLLERVAAMPPKDSTAFWRTWSETSKKRTVQVEKGKKGKKGRLPGGAVSPKKAVTARGGWPLPKEESTGSLKGQRSPKGKDASAEALPSSPSAGDQAAGGSKNPKRSPWNDRHSIMLSKDNEHLCMLHKDLFGPAEYNSGYKLADPRSYLDTELQKWRKLKGCREIVK